MIFPEFTHCVLILHVKEIKEQTTSTYSSLECKSIDASNIEEESNYKMEEIDINYLQPQKEEMVMWVWNNIMTRDKMRRKSFSTFTPMYHFAQRKRYNIIAQYHFTIIIISFLLMEQYHYKG